MKAKRVHCDNCRNFIASILEDEDNLFSKVIKNAQCKRGYRVMYRKPKSMMDSSDFGYVRFCSDYKSIFPIIKKIKL